MYPCDCEDMKWMVDNNKVFQKENNKWLLVWKEIDRDAATTTINNYAVTINYCVFCGKRIGNN